VDRRRTGTSQFVSQRRESDTVRILSGVFEGRTTGTPIGLLIENEDARSRDYEKIKDRFRPGHADYTYQHKYGFRDYRGGGRSSARETVMRVAAGAIARKYLAERLGVRIHGYLSQIGALTLLEPLQPPAAYENPFFCPDPRACRNSRQLIWTSARPVIRSARASRCGRKACRRAWASRYSTAGRRYRQRHDGHQCRQGGGDRRWGGGARSAAASTAMSSRRRLFAAITPAARSAASPRASRSSCIDALKPTSSIQVPGRTIDVAGNARSRS
jgi:hypothetical protein